MVRSKTILIVGAGLEQAIAIRQAKALGMRVIACDGSPEAIGFAEADVSIVANIKDVLRLCDIAREYRVDGVFAHAVEIPHIIAEVALRLGLPGLRPEVALRATNKIQRISHLRKHGVPCAQFEVVNGEADLVEKARILGFPLVIKPVDSAGSRGVRVVESEAELGPGYSEAIRYSSSMQVLLEERLSGPEVSTESIIYKGQIHTFAFADRNYARRDEFYPFFIEDGINYPSVLAPEMQQEIHKLVERTIRVLELDFGAAKGDVIIDKGVPKIIEMAARTSGGWFGAGSIPAATGSNMLKPLLQMAVGDTPDLDALCPTKQLGCAQRYVIPTAEGIVTDITGVKEAEKMPGVVMMTMFPPKSGSCIRRASNHAERYGQIICTATTREEAILRCEAAIARIKIRTRKDNA